MSKKRVFKCCVVNCINTSAEKNELIFHNLPKHPYIRKQWIESCNITKVTSKTRICSVHFKNTDYLNHKKLRKTAVPSAEPRKKKFVSNMLKKNQCDKKNEKCTLNSVSEVQNNGINNEQEKQQIQENEETVVEQSVHNQTEREIDVEICAKEIAKFCYECSSIISDNDDVQNNCQCFNIEVKNDSDDVPNISDSDVLQELKENLNISEDITNKMNEKVHNENKMRFMNLLRNDQDLIAFTGVSFQLLKSLIKAVTQVEGKNHYKFGNSVQDRIVLCLCKLRLNISFRCLAALFGLTRQSCTNNFIYMVQLLARILKSAIHWPSIEEIHKSMPICFKKFKNTYVVLDCTEIPVEKPRCLNCRLKLYSHYKGCETIKLLIGISPCGLLSFLSEAYGGRASDKAIFNQSGIINKLEPTRDAIMVDKGFNIELEYMQNYIQLIMPPKLEKKKQFNSQEVLLTKDIACARVHVERTIQRFKMFKIVKHKISWTLVPYIDNICIVVAALVNLKNPLLADDKF